METKTDLLYSVERVGKRDVNYLVVAVVVTRKGY